MKNISTLLTVLLSLLLSVAVLSSCNADSKTSKEVTDTVYTYEQISPKEAKALMDSEKDYVILDVRTTEEFAESHIAGAVLLTDVDIKTKAETVLTDKDQLILVYCRSGRRSKNASKELAELGYTNVKEFGGIIDWPYGTVSE